MDKLTQLLAFCCHADGVAKRNIGESYNFLKQKWDIMGQDDFQSMDWLIFFYSDFV